MDLGTYLKWNFILGGCLLILVLLGGFLFNNPYLAGIAVFVLAILAYRGYRKAAYFEGYGD